MGTIDYMAPEQGTDTHKVDGRADIYSLGATLYRLLTGKVPFAQYDTTIKKLTALATREPPPVVSLRPGCPVPLAALVQQMLAKDPAARPSSAAALVGALAPFARGADLRRLLGQPLGRQRDDLPSGGTAVGCNTAPSAYDETNLGAVPGRETIPAAAPPVAAASSGEATENPFGIDWSDRLPSARLVPRHKAISLRARLAVGALAAAIVAGGVYLLSTRNPSRRHNVPVAAPKEKTEPETVEQPAPPVEDHERSAATWVLANGGTVKLDGREQQIHDAAFLPERPFRLTGITLPESYGGVGLTETLQNLPHVTELAMGGNLVGDAQAAIVRDMPELVSLNLTHCPVGDDGLQHLVGHTRLQHVTLYCALNVRDDGLKHLSGLTELVTVHVGGTQVTDEGFKHLAGLTRLKYLSADNARVTGAGFRYLTHCKEIELAHLAHSGATDEGVAEICKFSSLRKLNLQYTAITDACVDLLCNHPNLIHINLGGSRVSAEAFTRLRKARPNCEVFGQP